eukprot:CAMPEP_0172627464 /NCGR_PEP_ID=MMETSP1068-20121228/156327_1 /TAXON_ID=35684 /ORGANISM="Pseudopedinella elastica, Strain CCMP716" /LENGTH=405 /DNA_ID=CAMNT_0013437353 /DNA_START=17 /DNA_END=1234 /DNA_ORIENTATION=-
MGSGASSNAQPGTTSVRQGVELRREYKFVTLGTGGGTAHFKFALVQCDMLKDSTHDQGIATSCLKSINEAMNDSVESADAKHLREELCGCGLDTIVVKLMGTFPKDADLQREGLVTLGSLAYKSDPRKARLMDLGAGQAIVSALEAHQGVEKLLEEGLWAAGNLSAGPEKLKDRFFAMGVAGAILSTITAQRQLANVTKTGLICIGNLSNGSEKRCAALTELGADRAIIQGLESHPEHTDVAAYSLFAAGNLSEGSRERGFMLAELGIVKLLAVALETHQAVRTVQLYGIKLATMLMRGSSRSISMSMVSTNDLGFALAETEMLASVKSAEAVEEAADWAPAEPGKSNTVSNPRWWRAQFDEVDMNRLVRLAKELHSGDKSGVVKWADQAIKELEKDFKKEAQSL